MPPEHVSAPAAPEPESVEPVLAVVREATGLDFLRYRPATVQRRIRNRMLMVGAHTVSEYLGIVSASRDEALRLAERITIKVSRLYRNRHPFDLLRHQLLPALAAGRSRPLDIWVAGCGCGEEAYTFAMLLEEAGVRGTVVATDIDGFALAAAAHGVYSRASIAELPAELAARFLSPAGEDRVAVTTAIRDRVRFCRHDVVADAPPPEPGAFAVVSCRNVLIYLQRTAQERALTLLRRAMEDNGVLVLGEAEWPLPVQTATLDVVSQRSRIFRGAARTGELHDDDRT